MWHEARKQERKIRGLMVDYKKRADRRKEFYEKIKLDPTQFLRVYGRPVKISFDPAVALAAESPQSTMPWQGDSANMIDRFDVRAHLDYIPEFTGKVPELTEEEEEEDRKCNYERYRTLVENEASGLSEEQCLHEIYIDEHFGLPNKSGEEEKKKNADKKAAIGYVYEDSTPAEEKDNPEEGSDEESSDTDVETADLDITLDVDTLTIEQEIEINSFAHQYGMKDEDFVEMLRKDKEELEALKHAKQIEEEKAQFSGRKSRRERRAFKEKQLQGRRISPPSYAAKSSPKYEPYKRSGSSSRSRSRSPDDVGKVKFITSFGAESEEEGGAATMQGPTLPPATNASAKSESSTSHTDSKSDSNRHQSWKNKSRPSNLRRKSRSRSRSRSRSHSRSGRRRSRSREARGRRRLSRSRSRSRSWSRSWDRRRRTFDWQPNSYRGPQRLLGRYDRGPPRNMWSRPRPQRIRSRSRSRGYRRSRSRTSVSKSRSHSSRSRSSSRSGSSKSRSSSKSQSRSRSKSSGSAKKERSKSPSPKTKPPVVVKRYRRASLSSRSSESEMEEDDTSSNKSASKDAGTLSRNRSGGSFKAGNTSGISQGKLTPQERLRRKMQAQLNKQYKADKRAEISKISKMEQERLDREEELRNRTMEMRRRERERRHKELEELERERRARRSRSGSSGGMGSDGDEDIFDENPSHSPRRSESPVDMEKPRFQRNLVR